MDANGGSWFEGGSVSDLGRCDVWHRSWWWVSVDGHGCWPWCCGTRGGLGWSSSSAYPCKVADFLTDVACKIVRWALLAAALVKAGPITRTYLAGLILGGVVLPADGLDVGAPARSTGHLRSLFLGCFLCSAFCYRFL